MHYFKYQGSKDSMKSLYENKEALLKYIARLKEFWDEDKQEWLSSPRIDNAAIQAKKLSNEDNPRQI